MNEITAAIEQRHDSLPAIIDRACRTLAEARTSAEVVEAMKLGELALHVAKLEKAGHEVEADCLLLITQAQRRVGEELIRARANGEIVGVGNPEFGPIIEGSDNSKPTLKDLGLTLDQSAEYQDLARVPEEVVTNAIKEQVTAGKPPTKAAVRRAVKKAKPAKPTPGVSRRELSKLTKDFGVPHEAVKQLEDAYPKSRASRIKAGLAGLPKATPKATINRLVDKALVAVNEGRKLPEGAPVDARLFWPGLPQGFCRKINTTDFGLIVKKERWFDQIELECGKLVSDGAMAGVIEARALTIWMRASDPGVPIEVAIAQPKDPKPLSNGEIKHDAFFCGEKIWPRNGEFEKSHGDHITERDVIVAYNLVHYWVPMLAMHHDRATVIRELSHLANAIAQTSSPQGLAKVMHQCVSAWAKANGDMTSCRSPGTLASLKESG